MSAPVLLCRYTYPNGAPCRAIARSSFQFCRHHTPEAIRRHRLAFSLAEEHSSSSPAPNPQPPLLVAPRPFSTVAHWRAVRGWIAQAPASEFPVIIEQIMRGLGRNLISHRCAGALLNQIQKRRQYLRLEALILRARELRPGLLTDEHVEAVLSFGR